jgi:ATP-dependent Clp protease protease subunit
MKVENSKFPLFAKDFGVSSLNIHNFNRKLEHHSNGLKNSMTPYIIEERSMNMTQMDVFSRLMMERILWVAGPVDENMATIVQAQLMFLDSIDDKEIEMYINTPGGSVVAGLSMVDVMDYIKSDISTLNAGMAASMGSILLGAGAKGKRRSLRFSKVMMHQSSGGATGNISDARIAMQEWEKYNNILFDLLGGYCGKPMDEVLNDANRDNWLNAEQALEYGIIDEIIVKRK